MAPTAVSLFAQVGTVRGEDYNFQFSGKIRDNKLHFRLQMEYEGDEDSEKVSSQSTVLSKGLACCDALSTVHMGHMADQNNMSPSQPQLRRG